MRKVILGSVGELNEHFAVNINLGLTYSNVKPLYELEDHTCPICQDLAHVSIQSCYT